MDDTLFAHQRSVGLGVTAKRHSVGGPMAAADDQVELDRWHRLEELHYGRYLRGELDVLDQRRERVREFVAPYRLESLSDADADGWYADYLGHYESTWILHDDTLPCLDALEERFPGVRFGIITNAELRFQTVKIERLGLGSRMEHVIASGEVGAAKPYPRIFRHACEVFGVAPSDAVYVGDRLHTDALGASLAGLTGVWLDRGVVTPTAEELAESRTSGVLTIGALTELPGTLAGRDRE